MSEINVGNLYDLNKELIKKMEHPLKAAELAVKQAKLVKYMVETNNSFYMLLNRENYDFTLFHLRSNEYGRIVQITDDLKECLHNRGKILSIEFIEETNAYEIWLLKDDEATVYYFFPYDAGVIEA